MATQYDLDQGNCPEGHECNLSSTLGEDGLPYRYCPTCGYEGHALLADGTCPIDGQDESDHGFVYEQCVTLVHLYSLLRRKGEGFVISFDEVREHVTKVLTMTLRGSGRKLDAITSINTKDGSDYVVATFFTLPTDEPRIHVVGPRGYAVVGEATKLGRDAIVAACEHDLFH